MYSPKPTRKPGDPPKPPTTQQPPEDTRLQSGGLPPGGPAMLFGKESGMPQCCHSRWMPSIWAQVCHRRPVRLHCPTPVMCWPPILAAWARTRWALT